ncbi:MAG: GGDEF domain-containing protein [Anaerolineales bacterium]|nr:GGDEF domain-containing protein [Anaerolineales bacterium]
MILDARTLGLLSALMPFVLGLIMSIYWRERRTYAGFGRWVLANFVFGAGYLFISLRGFIPDLLSIILGNAAIVYAEVLIYEGIRLFYGRPAFSKWNTLVFVLYLPLHIYFTYPNPNINARIVIVSVALFILIIRSGLTLVNNPHPELKRTTRNAGIIFLLTSILPLARTINALRETDPIVLFADLMSSWFTLLGLVSIMAWTFYFFLINSARLELDLEAARLELVKLATTDPLTGLYNRRHFFEHAEIEFQRAKRHEQSVSFLMMDVDGFKAINDRYGHDTGDAVLTHLASILPGEVRVFDLVARFGGDEFIVMLVNVYEEQSYEIAERIREIVAQTPFMFNSQKFNVYMSLGIASFAAGDEDLKTILKRADNALYCAKRNGKNLVCVG